MRKSELISYLISAANVLLYIIYNNAELYALIELLSCIKYRYRIPLFVMFAMHYLIPLWFYQNGYYSDVAIDYRIIIIYFLFSIFWSKIYANLILLYEANISKSYTFVGLIGLLALSLLNVSYLNFLIKAILIYFWINWYLNKSRLRQIESALVFLVTLLICYEVGVDKQFIVMLAIAPIVRAYTQARLKYVIFVPILTFPFLFLDYLRKFKVSFDKLPDIYPILGDALSYFVLGRFNLIEPTVRMLNSSLTKRENLLDNYILNNTYFPNIVTGVFPANIRVDYNPGKFFQREIYGLDNYDTFYVSLGQYGEHLLNSPQYYLFWVFFQIGLLSLTWIVIARSNNMALKILFVLRLGVFGMEGYFVERYIVFWKQALVIWVFAILWKYLKRMNSVSME